jgi:hypothetical protein
MRVLAQRSVLSAVRAQALPRMGRHPAAARCHTQRREVMNEAPAAAEYEGSNDDSTAAANLHGGRMPARRRRRTADANPMQMLLRVASVRGVRPP